MALSDEIEAFAAYWNGLPRARENFDAEGLAAYESDLAKARAAMERAYLERMVGGSQTPEWRSVTARTPRPTFGPAETVGVTTSDAGGEW